MSDPILTEIEIQLRLAQQAVNNVAAFVARVNSASEPNDTETDADGDEPFETYESAPPTPNGGRNGRIKKQRR